MSSYNCRSTKFNNEESDHNCKHVAKSDDIDYLQVVEDGFENSNTVHNKRDQKSKGVKDNDGNYNSRVKPTEAYENLQLSGSNSEQDTYDIIVPADQTLFTVCLLQS